MPRKRKVTFDIQVSIPQEKVEKLKDEIHKTITNEAIAILNSKEIESLKEAYISETSRLVTCCGRQILYENNIPCDNKYFGMSLFGADGFLLACKSFKNKKELVITLLHELHRQHTSAIKGSGIFGLVGEETKAAEKFSSYIYRKIFKG